MMFEQVLMENQRYLPYNIELVCYTLTICFNVHSFIWLRIKIEKAFIHISLREDLNLLYSTVLFYSH